jgi:hypothetical protein
MCQIHQKVSGNIMICRFDQRLPREKWYQDLSFMTAALWLESLLKTTGSELGANLPESVFKQHQAQWDRRFALNHTACLRNPI